MKVCHGEYDVRSPTCSWATRRIKIENAGMKRRPALIPALPNGNHDQKTTRMSEGHYFYMLSMRDLQEFHSPIRRDSM